MPAGGYEFVYIFTLTYICARFVNARTHVIVLSCCISLLGGILVLALPYENKAGLLAGYYIVSSTQRRRRSGLYIENADLLVSARELASSFAGGCQHRRTHQETRHQRPPDDRILGWKVGCSITLIISGSPTDKRMSTVSRVRSSTNPTRRLATASAWVPWSSRWLSVSSSTSC
jgi:hypothetical protein